MLASSWARIPETPTTRQTFSCTAMSTRIETRIANANAAPSSAVKTVVWVMKPGPMALVAIRNIAPRSAPRAPAPATTSGPVLLVLVLVVLVSRVRPVSSLMRFPSVGPEPGSARKVVPVTPEWGIVEQSVNTFVR